MTTPAEAIEVLNRALAADPDAVNELFSHRADCNRALANDPTIQVRAEKKNEGPFSVSILGLLNGIFGVRGNGGGYIAAVYEIQCGVHGMNRPEYKGLRVGDPCPIGDCRRDPPPRSDGEQRRLALGDLVRFKECKT